MKDIEKSLLEARGQLDQLFAYMAATDSTPVHEVERALFRGLLQLGRQLLVHFIAGQGVGDVGETMSLADGQSLARGAVRRRAYLSIFGAVSIERYVYGPPQIAPLDAALQLPAWKYSYLLQEWGLAFTTKDAFQESSQILDQILGLNLAVRTLERLSAQGSRPVDAFRQQQAVPCPEEEAGLLVATVGCKGVPQTRSKPAASKTGKRRTKGEKKSKKKMACVGAVYSIEPFVRSKAQVLDEVQRTACAPHRPVPCHKRVQAQLVDDKASVFRSLADQLDQRQPPDPKPVLFLADGERRLWALKKQYLPDAIGMLDLWHVMEYLWKGAHVFHPEGSEKAQAWVGHRLAMLLDGQVGHVISGLQQMATKHRLTGAKKKTLQSIITYFHNHRAHMRYDQYLAHGYPIGSGVAEGACRHLVKDRMERTGMRWTLAGAQAILSTSRDALFMQQSSFKIDHSHSLLNEA